MYKILSATARFSVYLYPKFLSENNFPWLSLLQSQTKVVGTLTLDDVSPFPPNQCRKMSRFFFQEDKYPIFNIVSGEEDNLLDFPTFPSGTVV